MFGSWWYWHCVQLNRPDLAAAAVRKKATQQFQQQKLKQQQTKEAGMAAKKDSSATINQATQASSSAPKETVEATRPESIDNQESNSPEEPSKKIKKWMDYLLGNFIGEINFVLLYRKKKKPKPSMQSSEENASGITDPINCWWDT